MSSSDSRATVLDGAILGEIAARRAIGVAGRDRASYLQGLLTNDIQALTAGNGCYAAWLTPQGRMLTDLHVLESGDMILLDAPLAQHAQTLARLDQFLFSEDVLLTDLGESLRPVWVHGTEAASCIERVVDIPMNLSAWGQYRNARTALAGAAIVVARIDQLGVPGFCLYVDSAQVAAVTDALIAAGVSHVSSEALEVARIEAAYPLFGVDMTDDTIPLEAGLEDRAISQTKGCYVGQEIIIRVLHRGQGRVARRLAQLAVAEGVPPRGARILAGEREIGRVTSAADSSREGPLALGYLHRDFAVPGSTVTVDLGGTQSPARVMSLAGR